MPHLKILLIALGLCSLAFSQSSLQQRLREAFVLDQQGRFMEAIAIAQSLTEAPNELGEIDQGRAYLVLAIAYQQQGSVADSERAYQKSLELLARHREDVTDYTSVLESFGGLYNETGRIDAAGEMWSLALRLRERNGDHASAARSLMDLTGFALSRHQMHEAKRYFKRLSQEMHLARDLSDDDFAVFFETQGWLALSEGKPAAGVEAYQRALEISKRNRGEQHWIVGWDRMLLGKAYAQGGDLKHARAEMREGLALLGKTLGIRNYRYFSAQIAYSHVLDSSGMHSEAAQLKATAETAVREMYAGQCVACTINVTGFR